LEVVGRCIAWIDFIIVVSLVRIDDAGLEIKYYIFYNLIVFILYFYIFNNNFLAALTLKQDGFYWGFLVHALGFGGSMIWFGSFAGVALCNVYPLENWSKTGLSMVSFAVLLMMMGWHPGSQLRAAAPSPAVEPRNASEQIDTSALQTVSGSGLKIFPTSSSTGLRLPKTGD